MKYNIRNIKKELKTGDLVYWYDDSSKLILSGGSKITTQKKISKLNLKNNTKLIRLCISFHSGKKLGQSGQIAVSSKLFQIDDNQVIKKEWEKDLIGYIWFGDNYLSEVGWKNYFLTKIISKLNSGKFKFLFGTPTYEQNIK